MKKLTGDLIEAYHRHYLDAEELSEWATDLLVNGHETESIIMAAACPDLSWEEVGPTFKRILKELEVTADLDSDVEGIKKEVYLSEYRQGLRPGGEVLKKFDDLRREIGFPDMVGFTILGNDYEGNEKAGYHTLDRKLHGEKLEREIRKHLEKAGKV